MMMSQSYVMQFGSYFDGFCPEKGWVLVVPNFLEMKSGWERNPSLFALKFCQVPIAESLRKVLYIK